jgi:hypothetical protein
MCESASFKNWRSGETSIVTFRPQKSRNQVRNQNSDQNSAGICNLARRHVTDHLNTIHSTDLPRLTDAQLQENDLYVCRECKVELFVSTTALNNHVWKKHNPTRILNNLQLVEQIIFKDLAGSCDSDWNDGLAFLSELTPQPPTFWQPLTTSIRWRLEQSVTETFLNAVDEATNESLKPLVHSNPTQQNRC